MHSTKNAATDGWGVWRVSREWRSSVFVSNESTMIFIFAAVTNINTLITSARLPHRLSPTSQSPITAQSLRTAACSWGCSPFCLGMFWGGGRSATVRSTSLRCTWYSTLSGAARLLQFCYLPRAIWSRSCSSDHPRDWRAAWRCSYCGCWTRWAWWP